MPKGVEKFALTTILRILLLYKPLRSFLALAVVLGGVACLIGLRFLYFYFTGEGSGHIQSLLAGVALAVFSALSLTIGIVCDIIAANRLLLEDIRYRLLKQELDATVLRDKTSTSTNFCKSEQRF